MPTNTSNTHLFTHRPVINAWGTATPYGVSRSSASVAQAASQALQSFVDIRALQQEVGRRLAGFSGAQWGCITHCTAAGVTLSVAAILSGNDLAIARSLPARMPRRHIVMLRAHVVDYGQNIDQAIRLAGAQSLVVERMDDVRRELERPNVAGVLAVESHLAKPSDYDLSALVGLCRAAGLPLVVDAAAQDFRVPELVEAGPDLLLVSGQKYLASPTAGLVFGRKDLVDAVELQHSALGRGMKPTKEAMYGVLAALDEREQLDTAQLWQRQAEKVERFARRLQGVPSVTVSRVPDPSGNPFERVWVTLGAAFGSEAALAAASKLMTGEPAVVVAPHRLKEGTLVFELLALRDDEIDRMLDALISVLNALSLPSVGAPR